MKRAMMALAIGALLLVGSAAPASAVDGGGPNGPVYAAVGVLQPVHLADVGIEAFSDCPASYSCFWTSGNGGGSRWDAPSCGGWHFDGHFMDNNMESVRNRGGGTVHLYNSYDARNNYLRSVVNNGANVNLASNHRNIVSSIRVDC